MASIYSSMNMLNQVGSEKRPHPSSLTEPELYDELMKLVMPVERLERYGYPVRDPNNPSLRKVPPEYGGKQQLRSQFADSYECERCKTMYKVDSEGIPLFSTGECTFHDGYLHWNNDIFNNRKRYTCCKGGLGSRGCCSNKYHVHRGNLELENFKGYLETQPKPWKDPNQHVIYALDCEMCHTTYGLELTQITIINYKSEVVYEKLVKPAHRILSYNTKFSGIKEGDLDHVNTTLQDVQRDLLDLFSSKTMLVGHSLDSDMKALKIYHQRFIDTAQLFPHNRGLPYKRALKNLIKEHLGQTIQEDAGHDSGEDAKAAFRLILWKLARSR